MHGAACCRLWQTPHQARRAARLPAPVAWATGPSAERTARQGALRLSWARRAPGAQAGSRDEPWSGTSGWRPASRRSPMPPAISPAMRLGCSAVTPWTPRAATPCSRRGRAGPGASRCWGRCWCMAALGCARCIAAACASRLAAAGALTHRGPRFLAIRHISRRPTGQDEAFAGHFTPFAGRFAFSADSAAAAVDGLYLSDGTAAGTRPASRPLAATRCCITSRTGRTRGGSRWGERHPARRCVRLWACPIDPGGAGVRSMPGPFHVQAKARGGWQQP